MFASKSTKAFEGCRAVSAVSPIHFFGLILNNAPAQARAMSKKNTSFRRICAFSK